MRVNNVVNPFYTSVRVGSIALDLGVKFGSVVRRVPFTGAGRHDDHHRRFLCTQGVETNLVARHHLRLHKLVSASGQ